MTKDISSAVSRAPARYNGRVMRVDRPAMAIAALGGLAGCSLLVDLSDTTGGTDAGVATGDAGVASADAGVASADARAASADAGVASADAARPAPVGSWCAENAASLFFCDDFEDGPLGSRWNSSTLQVSGAATLSSTNDRSAPYGFEIACPSLMPSTFLMEVLTESIPPASRIALAFDFDPLVFPADGHGGTLYLATITQGPGTPRSAIQFRAGTSLTDLQEQVILASGAVKSGTGQWESATLVQTGMWTRVEVDLDLTSAPATVALRLAGRTVATGTLDASWTRAPATLELGDWYIPTEPSFDVAYDNVTIALQP
jgi:hypothetical protein